MDTILYVEDELDYQLLVKRILEKSGHSVQVATTGAEGLLAIDMLKPRLVILDINLPDTDGYSLCAKLRKGSNGRNVPIMMLTVRRRPEEWLKGFSSGADDYMAKPLNPPELVERVQACMEGRRHSREESDGAEYLLIQAAVTGNRTAFAVIIQKYQERLLANMYANGVMSPDAEDVVSFTFARAFEKLNQFRGEASFYSWLYRIAMNEVHRLRPEMKTMSYDVLIQGDESQFPKEFIEDSPKDPEMSRCDGIQLQKAMECVPRPYQQMLRWYFLRGMSCPAMSKRLKIPKGTVMSRLFTARQLLRQAWNNNNH